MKKLATTISFILFSYCLGASTITAQRISGKQTKSIGSKVKRECKTVKIEKVVTITKVAGNNAGFWIQKGKNTFKKFWKPNDASVLGLTLQPGSYCVYPNVPPEKEIGTVILYYK